MTRIAQRDAKYPIAQHEPFQTHTGSLSALYATVGNVSTLGALPDRYRADLASAFKRAGRNLYVVRSYLTPIAWHDGTRWTIPDHKYSPTTSKHQFIVRWATRDERMADMSKPD